MILDRDLIMAIEDMDLTAVKAALVRGEDVNDTSYGTTPVHLAADYGDLDVLNEILKHKPNVSLLDEYGRTALHEACLHGNTEAACILIRAGWYLHAIDDEGLTPLQLAEKEGHSYLVKYIENEFCKGEKKC